MTAIVTLDQTVPALTADLGVSTTAENLALKTAMTNAGILGGGGGGSGAVTECTTLSSTTSRSVSVGTFGTPVETTLLYDPGATTVSFGSWNGSFSVFTFSRACIATVSFGMVGYLESSTTQTDMTMAFRLKHNNTYYWSGGNPGSQNRSLLVSEASSTVTRAFAVGDTISTIVAAQATYPQYIVNTVYGYSSLFPTSRPYFSIANLT